MSRMPRRQYASSSLRVVFRPAAQESFFATLSSVRSHSCVRASVSIPLMREMVYNRSCFQPIGFQSLPKKATLEGAMSSCKVQPRVHLCGVSMRIGWEDLLTHHRHISSSAIQWDVSCVGQLSTACLDVKDAELLVVCLAYCFRPGRFVVPILCTPSKA